MKTKNIHFTDHASIRAAQRGISQEMIYAAINHGEINYKQGLRYFISLERNLLGIVPNSLLDQYRNTVVIVAPDNYIITCYKNRNAYSIIKKKSKRLCC